MPNSYTRSITAPLNQIPLSSRVPVFTHQPQSFASPLMTSFSSVKASTANCTMFASRSPPKPVFSSFVNVPLSVATASATYPLQRISPQISFHIPTSTCTLPSCTPTIVIIPPSHCSTNSRITATTLGPSVTSKNIPQKKLHTYGVLFGDDPPVGPAVPDSLTAYVLCSVALTFSARPETICGVGPL